MARDTARNVKPQSVPVKAAAKAGADGGRSGRSRSAAGSQAQAETPARPLWRAYEALPPHEKEIVRLRALIGRPVARAAFLTAARAAEAKDANGRAWSAARLDQLCAAPHMRKLLCDRDGCVSQILHDATVEAAAGEDGAKRLEAVAPALPRSIREKKILNYFDRLGAPAVADDFDLSRRLRFTLYADDEAGFARLRDIYLLKEENHDGSAALDACLATIPLVEPWLSGRGPVIRAALQVHVLSRLLDRASPRSDGAAVIDRCAAAAPESLDPVVNLLLLRREILWGDLAAARRRLAAAPGSEGHGRAACAAAVDFLSGNNQGALAGFRTALRLLRKNNGQRRIVLPAELGVFHALALLRAGDPASREELRKLIDASGYPYEASGFNGAYGAAKALLSLISGDEADAAAHLAQVAKGRAAQPLSGAVVALAGFFIDIEAAARRPKTYENERERVAGRCPLAARIYAEILARTGKGDAPWRGRVAELGGEAMIGFCDILTVKPGWERAFDSLAAFLDPAAAGVAAAAPRIRRLAWVIQPETRLIEPVEQTAKGDGWTAGRPVALKRLFEQGDRLDYLTDHDRRVVGHLRGDVHWSHDRRYGFDVCGALLALVGHPNVYHADARSRRIDLVAAPVELVVRETPDGYNFSLSHQGDAPSVFVEAETPTRWRVIELTETLLQLQASLGKGGLTVPRGMRDRVAALLGSANPTVPIRSELEDLGVPAIEGDGTPVLQLQPLGEGLKLNIAVRPFGPEGPFFLAGEGGRSVLAACAGVRQRANRDLDAEKAAAAAIVAACPGLEPWRASDNEWHIESVEGALEFLVQAQAFEQPLRFEWPEGESFKVSRILSAQSLSLRVSQRRDWFQVSGRIQVDEDLVLDMQDLMARLGQARGRFVPLEGGRFIALATDFQRQLARLEGVSEETADGRRLHGLAAMAVEDLVGSAGQVEADRHWRALEARLRAAEAHAPEIPSTLQAELRDYQREGFVWLSRLANLQMGACLADDMGLGKTVQTIALMVEQQAKGACLVVAPTSVCHNWESELGRFAPTLTAHRLAATADRSALIERMGPGDVLIASYGLLHQEEEKLTGRGWRMAVFDEAQNLKNAETRRARASQKIDATFRLALSGTPVENDIDELWSLFNTINPGLLGSRDGFQRRFAGPIERERKAGARDALRALIRPFILRRTKAAVLDELPPRTELAITVQMGGEERAFYEAARRRALEALAEARLPAGQRKLQILAEITRLRRACCHPALIDPKTELESAKLAAFLELIDELLRNRHKALVFSQFLGLLEKARDALDARGVRYQYLDGSVPAQARAERVAAFQGGAGDLFLISLKAGGTGLNLTAADYVIHLDPWWNPAVEDQASDRAHRIGQTRPVTVYRLVVEDSIEERILELHKQKRDLAAELLDGAEVSGRLSEEELIALIRG